MAPSMARTKVFSRKPGVYCRMPRNSVGFISRNQHVARDAGEVTANSWPRCTELLGAEVRSPVRGGIFVETHPTKPPQAPLGVTSGQSQRCEFVSASEDADAAPPELGF